jgi:hypothetical protein
MTSRPLAIYIGLRRIDVGRCELCACMSTHKHYLYRCITHKYASIKPDLFVLVHNKWLMVWKLKQFPWSRKIFLSIQNYVHSAPARWNMVWIDILVGHLHEDNHDSWWPRNLYHLVSVLSVNKYTCVEIYTRRHPREPSTWIPKLLSWKVCMPETISRSFIKRSYWINTMRIFWEIFGDVIFIHPIYTCIF